MKLSAVLLLATIASAGNLSAQDDEVVMLTPGISAGMGVNYHNMQDVVDRINGTSIGTQRAAEFKSGVEFFGAFALPLSPDWVLKLEYSYLLASYSQSSAFGNAEFSYAVHMPTVIGQYVMWATSTYNFKAGMGFGWHFGSYSEKYAVIDATFRGSGVGALLELEGNTALGEKLYAHLGTQLRWDFIGNVTDGAGSGPSGTLGPLSLNFFSVGARLGLTYHL